MKTFLVQHGEKLALVLCIAVGGWLINGAISTKSYSRKPEDFSTASQRAEANVTSTPAQLDKLQAPDMAAVNSGVATPIDSSSFRFGTRWMRPFDFGQSFRNEPAIFAPIKPIVQSNRGAISLFKVDATGKRVTRKVKQSEARGALVVDTKKTQPVAAQRAGGRPGRNARDPELVAMEQQAQQEAESRKMFEMVDPGAMANPEATGFAPIAPAGPVKATRRVITEGKKSDGKPDDKKAADKEVEVAIEEVTGKRWVEVVSAFPNAKQIREYVKALREPCNVAGLRYAYAEIERRELQPDYEWSQWAKIPLQDQLNVILNARETVDETAGLGEAVISGLAMKLPQLSSSFRFNLPDADFSAQYFNQKEPEQYEDEFWDPTLLNPKKGEQGNDAPERRIAAAPVNAGAAPVKSRANMPGMPGMPGAPGAGETKVTFNNHFEVANVLIRFWDFTVLPGKRYQYRVRVKTYNPNHKRRDVADSEFALKDTLEGPWSEESDEVYVEPDTNWYAALKQDTSRNDRATIEVHFWSKDMGEWVTKELTHRVGELIGLSGIRGDYDFVRFDDQNRQFVVQPKTIADEMDVRAVVLDVEGGRVRETLGKDAKIFRLPKEIIAVNEYGDIIRRNEADDANNEQRQAIAASYQGLIEELRGGGTPGGAAGADNGAMAPTGDIVDPTAKTKKGR